MWLALSCYYEGKMPLLYIFVQIEKGSLCERSKNYCEILSSISSNEMWLCWINLLRIRIREFFDVVEFFVELLFFDSSIIQLNEFGKSTKSGSTTFFFSLNSRWCLTSHSTLACNCIQEKGHSISFHKNHATPSTATPKFFILDFLQRKCKRMLKNERRKK